jgi:hypothetical protein
MKKRALMRVLPALIALAVLALITPAGAQSPPAYPSVLTPPPLPAHTPATTQPHASARPAAVTTFTNPGGKGRSSPMSASACNRAPRNVPASVNPITGQPQAATIVSVPITKGGGSIANATSQKQTQEACAHH